MVRNRVKLQRHSLRLENYGYDQPGGYFVTTCTFGRENLFDEIQDGSMRLNRYGEIVRECLKSIPEHFDNAEVD